MSFSRIMSFSRKDFYIKENSLAEALNLEPKIFDSIVNYLEKFPDENPQLKEHLHFVVQYYVLSYYVEKQPIRLFSREGALVIAKHIDMRGETTEDALKKVVKLLNKYRCIKIDGKVLRTVYENSSSLVLRNKRHWLSREDVVHIFRTSSLRLDRAFKDIQRSDAPMKINVDFENYGEQRFFSLSGLEKLSMELSLKLCSKERRYYCSRVKEVAPPVVEQLSLFPSPTEDEIKKAVNFVKNKDKCCQISCLVQFSG